MTTSRAWKKPVLWTTGVLSGLALILALTWAFGVDPLARRTFESLAREALGVPVYVRGATIQMRGKVDIQGMEISNPGGFQEPLACEIQGFDGFLDLSSFSGKEIVIHDMVVIRPVFTVEFAGGKSNWAVLVDTLLQGIPADAPKFRITRLRLREATIRIRSAAAAGGLAVFHLPDVELENFGDAPGTASTFNLLFAALLQILAGGAMEQEEAAFPGDHRKSFGEEVKGAAAALEAARKSGKK